MTHQAIAPSTQVGFCRSPKHWMGIPAWNLAGWEVHCLRPGGLYARSRDLGASRQRRWEQSDNTSTAGASLANETAIRDRSQFCMLTEVSEFNCSSFGLLTLWQIGFSHGSTKWVSMWLLHSFSANPVPLPDQFLPCSLLTPERAGNRRSRLQAVDPNAETNI